MVDNRGFAAMIASVDRLRGSVESSVDRVLGVERAARDELRSQTQKLDQLLNSFRGIAQGKDRAIATQNITVKSVNIAADTVNITAKTLNVRVQGGARSVELSAADIGKSVASELQKVTLKTQAQSSLVDSFKRGFLEYGVFAQLGQSVAQGIQKGFKSQTGISGQTVGAGVGRAIANPDQSLRDTISWRRKLELEKSLREAEKQALKEDIKIAEGKQKIFAVGGTVGQGGRGGSYVKRILRTSGLRDADIETVANPNTDADFKDPYLYLASAGLKQFNNQVIRGSNPDAIALASKVIAARKKDPNVPISLFGHSAGSSVVEEALAILEKGGYSGIKGIGAGAVDQGTGYGVSSYKGFSGHADQFIKSLGFTGPRTNTESFPGFGNLASHSFQDYVAHPEFIKNIEKSFQPKVVQNLLERHYQGIVEKSFEQFEQVIADLSPQEQASEVGANLRSGFNEFIEKAAKEAEAFADEFNAMFSDQDIAPINATLAKYDAARRQTTGTGRDRVGISAAPPPVVQQAKAAIESPINSLKGSIDRLIKALDNFRINIAGQGNLAAGEGVGEGAQASAISLRDKYIVYLNKILSDAKANAEDQIKALNPDFESLTIQGKRDFATSFNEDIKAKAKQFRAAIEAGDRELSQALGEEILAKTQAIKKIYADLSEQATTLTAKKSISGSVSYLTSLEGEVVRGRGTRNKPPQGLIQQFGAAEDAAKAGDDTAQGFLQGIDDKLKEVFASGEAIGEEAVRGAKSALLIASPSQAFVEIAQNVVQGFNNGIEGFGDEAQNNIKGFVRKSDTAIASWIDGLNAKINGLFAALEEKFPFLGRIKDLVIGFLAGVVIEKGISFLTDQFLALADASFDVVVQFESLKLAFTSVTGGADEGAKGLENIRNEANRLGLELQSTEEAYLGLRAATRYSSLEGVQTDKIFNSFAQTASLRGLDNESQGRMFTALNQIISKKKLSAEEVRGQLGEIGGLNFESTLARSMGLQVAQLDKAMSDGLLLAEDVLPKVAAQYAAENAAISGASETTGQALNRFNNKILELQRTFEGWVAGSKVFFNFFASGIDSLIAIMPTLIKILGNLILTLAITNASGLAGALLRSGTAAAIFRSAIGALFNTLKAALPAIASFLKEFLLISLAIDAVTNALNIASDAFPEQTKAIADQTAGLQALKQSYLDAANAAKTPIKPNLPKDGKDVVTDRTFKPFGFDTGFNLEGTRRFLGLRTLGQKESLDFQANSGDVLANTNKNLFEFSKNKGLLSEIQKIDDQLNALRSKRFDIQAGDKTAFNESMAAEQQLLENRDRLLKSTSQFAQNLEGDQNRIKAQLAALDELVAKGGITQYDEQSIRQQLLDRLDAVEKTKSTFEDLTSSLTKQVNALERALRNLNEKAIAFRENIENSTQAAQAEIFRQAAAGRQGSQATSLRVDQTNLNQNRATLGNNRQQIRELTRYLQSPEFAPIVAQLRRQTAAQGLTLESSGTLQRLLDEGRSPQDQSVIKTLQQIVQLRSEVAGQQNQLAQAIYQGKENISNLGRSLQDYFLNLIQQIEQVQLEIKKQITDLRYNQIKDKLNRVLLPGAESFVNELVTQSQNIIDQAQQIAAKVFENSGQKIQLAGETKSLQDQFQDFANNLGGANEAIAQFTQYLRNAASGAVNNVVPTGGKLGGKVSVVGSGGAYEVALAAIRSGEGGYSSVNRGRSGDTPGGLRSLTGKNADQMTVREILALQKAKKISAVGAYQVIPSTLLNAVKKMGISLDALFNKELQDRIAIWLLNARPAIRKYLQTGQGEKQAAIEFSKEWASIPNPVTGQSYYQGDSAGNASSGRRDRGVQALRSVRQNLLSGKTDNLTKNNAQTLTNTLIDGKQQLQAVNDAGLANLMRKYGGDLSVVIEQAQYQSNQTIKNLQQASRDAFRNSRTIIEQYQPQSAAIEFQRKIRSIEEQFRDRDLSLLEQESGIVRTIASLERYQKGVRDAIAKLKASGDPGSLQAADALGKQLETVPGQLVQLKKNLTEIKGFQSASAQALRNAIAFERQRYQDKINEDVRQQQDRASGITRQLGASTAKAQGDLQLARAAGGQRELIGFSQQQAESELQYREKLAELIKQKADYEREYQQAQISPGRVDEAIQADIALADQQIAQLRTERGLRLQIAAIEEQQTKLRAAGIELSRSGQILDAQANLAQLEANKLINQGEKKAADTKLRDIEIQQERLRLATELNKIQQENANDETTIATLSAIANQTSALRIEEINSKYKDLGDTIADIGKNGLAEFLTSTLSGTKSVGDAFDAMAQNILQTLSGLFSQLAVAQIFKLFGFSVGGLPGAQLPGFAAGGHTGYGDRSKIAGFVHGEEFVFNANTTEAIGANLLANINATGRLPTVAVPVAAGRDRGSSTANTYNISVDYSQRTRGFTQERTIAREIVDQAKKASR
jgi:tape measure domain-containing protein